MLWGMLTRERVLRVWAPWAPGAASPCIIHHAYAALYLLETSLASTTAVFASTPSTASRFTGPLSSSFPSPRSAASLSSAEPMEAGVPVHVHRPKKENRAQ